MVIKGGARSGAAGLSAHLQRLDTNELAEVRELRGVAAQDLDGALREMEAVASGSRSQKHFYHASINTRADEVMTPEQWKMAVDRLEKELRLDHQPRAVVFHLKEGRAHVHVVWSRIDLDKMVAISDSHNFRRHEIVARELEREFGHVRVQGVHVERDGQPRPDRTPSHAEAQQAERRGLDPSATKTQLTEIWSRTDSGKAFAAAIEAHGWILASGNQRDFVVVDQAGEVHSLARRIGGATAKDIRGRMSDVDKTTLPSVTEAKQLQTARQKEAPEAAPEARNDIEQQERDRDDERPEHPSVATSKGGMVAQQLEALWRFEKNSAQMNSDREARAELLRRAEQPENKERGPEIVQKGLKVTRDDPGDISR